MNTKTAFITGASGGIGSAIARKLAANGYDLAICCHTDTLALNELRSICMDLGSRCICYSIDVCNAEELQDTIADTYKRLGSIDLLVNNAGISHIGLMTDMTLSQWNQVISTNLTSAFLTCHDVVPHMVAKKEGRIINISSMWGDCGASCEVAYSASKAGLNGFTKALAKELAPSGICVNAIAPGVIDTKMNACFSPKERQALIEEIPANRMGLPEEVAELVYQAATAPTYMNGQIITIDGGLL